MVIGEGADFGPAFAAVGRPVQLLQLLILAQGFRDDAAFQEELQFGPRGVGGGAAVAADGEGPAGVGVFQGDGPGFVIEPAFQKAGHETIARAKDVEHFYRKAGAGLAFIQAGGDWAGEGGGPHRPAFADEGGVGNGPDGAQGGDGVGGATGDVEFLFGADDQVKEVQGALQFLRDRRR